MSRSALVRLVAGSLATVALLTLTGCASTPSAAGGAGPLSVAPAALPSPAPAVASRPAAPLPGQLAAPMLRSVPVRLRISAIGVDAALVRLGLRADGTMDVPAAALPAGWYDGSPTPGELGPAVVAGHVDWSGRAGVFHELHRIALGDQIAVTRDDGSVATFDVYRIEQLRKDRFPTDAVYGDIDHAGLRLITCGGRFDPHAHSYVDNVIAFARLVSATTASR